jgi:diguanylate cyclase (GGDEF)-like protein
MFLSAFSVPDRPKRRFLALVALPAIGFAAAIVLFGLWSLWVTAQRSDLATGERQAREVHLAIAATLDELAQSQAGVAIWDPAVAELRKPRPDLDWIDQNVGTWLNYVFNHEIDVIVDGHGQPVYAMVNGVRRGPDTFTPLRAAMAPLIASVRGRDSLAANPHERLPGRRLHPKTSVRTAPAAIHATDLVEVNGAAAVASVMRMVPDSQQSELPAGTEPLLISIRYLNSGLMQHLQRERGIAGARITRATAGKGSEETSVPLRSSRGRLIGYFTWRPEMPGKAILASMLPRGAAALVAILVLLTALIGSVGRLMFKDARSIEALEAAHLELQAKEAQAQYLAYHDALTALPNRSAFGKFLDQAIATLPGGRCLGVLLIDLDRFKHVNDTLGHLAGDKLIEAVATRLVARMKEGNIVARLGGDEFAICVTESDSKEGFAKAAEAVLAELRRPFEILGSVVHVGGSVGIAICPDQGTDRAELLRKADIAMYRAKESGRDAFRFFSAEMDESIVTRRAIEEDLRGALDSGTGLFVAYQPQLDASGQRVLGLEALVRWDHPVRGQLAPDGFIPVAEECGLIERLGSWVLGEACKVARQWPGLSMAVNVSPIQFRTPGFAEAVRATVTAAGVEPEQIELEVTEGILLEADGLVKHCLEELRTSGFRIAIDDFGTGYSSLSYLKKFKVDRIKIDRSFIKRLGHDAEATAIVQAVITLGHAMALSVTAEGVETEEQGSLLKVAGCNELQGFLYSIPVTAAELERVLGARGPTAPSRALAS